MRPSDPAGRNPSAGGWEWRGARYDLNRDYLELARTQAEGIIAGAVHEARAVAGDLEVEGNPLIGNAAARLLEESAHAELTVLGSRGRGGLGSLLLGSVSRRVATHAAGPVVVVRGRDEGPVVAGVDDSPGADIVRRAAFEAAAGRDTGLFVVRSYLPEAPLWLGDVATAVAEGQERAGLTEQPAPWRARFPEVPVQPVLTHETAASALVTASERAQLVIVGSRGPGCICCTTPNVRF